MNVFQNETTHIVENLESALFLSSTAVHKSDS